MPNIDKKAISEALVQAMNKEELHTRQCASYLNLNPCYISMAQNPKSWDSMGKAAWIRLRDWFDTNEPIHRFQIPDGEEIWKPKEKTTEVKPGVEGEKAQKAFEKELKAHDERVIERNRMPNKAFEKMLNKVGEIKPSDRDYAIAAPEPMRIPIQLDLKINIEVCLFGKSVNISMP
jgi:hypothetical protein